MVRFILFLALIIFIIWIFRPFLKTKHGNKKNNKLEDIINEMIKSDRKITSKKSLLIKHGYKINKISND